MLQTKAFPHTGSLFEMLKFQGGVEQLISGKHIGKLVGKYHKFHNRIGMVGEMQSLWRNTPKQNSLVIGIPNYCVLGTNNLFRFD